MNELLQLLAQANAAIGRGVAPAAVNARLAEVTNGQFTSVRALGQHLKANPTQPQIEDAKGNPIPPDEAAALLRLNERPGNAVTDFLGQAGHGASFGLAPELGRILSGGGEAGAAREQQLAGTVADNRLVNQGGARAADLAGGLAIPIGGAGAVGRQVLARGGSRLMAGAAGGAAVGGAAGLLTGAGEAEGGIGNRIQGGLLGGALGAAGGALLAPVGAALGRIGPSRGPRVANDLRRLSGVSEDIGQTMQRADDALRNVQETRYRPLEEANPAIGGGAPQNEAQAALIARLNEPDIAPHARAVLKRSGADQMAPPSFEEAQQIIRRLRRVGGKDRLFAEQVDELTGLLDQAVPGSRAADAAYAQASEVRRAITQGRRAARGTSTAAPDIDRMTAKMTPEAREAFRKGQLHEYITGLERRDTGMVGKLRQFMDAGPETERLMRQLLPDEQAFNEFQRILRDEARADTLRGFLAKAGLIGAGAGAADLLGIDLF